MRRVKDQDEEGKGPGDQGTRPEDQGTTGPGDQRIRGLYIYFFFQGPRFFPGNLDCFSSIIHHVKSNIQQLG